MILALAAALIFAPLQAQEEETGNFTQITIHVPDKATPVQEDAQVAAFTAATRTITRCDQIEAVAKQVGGDVVAVQNFALSDFPDVLRPVFAGKPAGTVSQVFGERPDYRVLIRC